MYFASKSVLGHLNLKEGVPIGTQKSDMGVFLTPKKDVGCPPYLKAKVYIKKEKEKKGGRIQPIRARVH